jgi:hypothetical protein
VRSEGWSEYDTEERSQKDETRRLRYSPRFAALDRDMWREMPEERGGVEDGGEVRSVYVFMCVCVWA